MIEQTIDNLTVTDDTKAHLHTLWQQCLAEQPEMAQHFIGLATSLQSQAEEMASRIGTATPEEKAEAESFAQGLLQSSLAEDDLRWLPLFTSLCGPWLTMLRVAERRGDRKRRETSPFIYAMQ